MHVFVCVCVCVCIDTGLIWFGMNEQCVLGSEKRCLLIGVRDCVYVYAEQHVRSMSHKHRLCGACDTREREIEKRLWNYYCYIWRFHRSAVSILLVGSEVHHAVL